MEWEKWSYIKKKMRRTHYAVYVGAERKEGTRKVRTLARDIKWNFCGSLKEKFPAAGNNFP